nr:uncharacterized protein LOC112019222 [Quercus suber]
MTRFQENREKGVRLESDICAKVIKRLHKEKLASNRWLACWARQTQFEVKHGLQSFTVDLATTHCSCRKWNIIGIPCAHAISCIFFNRQDAEQYVHPCYHVSTYRACYEPIIAPINGQNMWRPSDVTPVQPPIKRRSPSKLKKKKLREPNELTSGKRAGISKQCKACGKLGHNKRSCKGEIGGNSSLSSTTNKTSTYNKTSKSTSAPSQARTASTTPFAPHQAAMHSPSNPSPPYQFRLDAPSQSMTRSATQFTPYPSTQ